MAKSASAAGESEGLTDQASAKVQEAASTVQEKTSELREKGSAQLRSELDTRTNEFGGQARSVAGALRRTSDSLQEENAGAAKIVTGAADRVERIGGYLEQKSGDDIFRDVENFARRRPWLIAGAGVLVGIAVARFVKASSEERYGESRPDWRPASYGSWSPQRQTTRSGAYAAIGAPSEAEESFDWDADAPVSRERFDNPS